MLKSRALTPEWLDTLAADDPRAHRSRGDLRRINRLMGASPLLARSLDTLLARTPGAPLVELGAGDGSQALHLAQLLSPRWPNLTLGLLDLHPVVSDTKRHGFDALGWDVQVIQADALEWLGWAPSMAETTARPIMFANLFVHHFEGARLHALLAGIADRAQAFVCLEPRRSTTALLGSQLLGVIGCNAVTRHDAVVSVRAGFAAQELSSCWPNASGWLLRETTAGPFSHHFAAERQPP